MSRYTIVSNGGTSYAASGTVTRDDAIREARDAFSAEYMRLKQFLSLPVDQLAVRVVDGMHAERLIRELLPAPEKQADAEGRAPLVAGGQTNDLGAGEPK
jgi:hypothetical protein